MSQRQNMAEFNIGHSMPQAELARPLLLDDY